MDGSGGRRFQACSCANADTRRWHMHKWPRSSLGLMYSTPGGLWQDPVRAVESPAVARTYGNRSRGMRVLLSAYGSRGEVEPVDGTRGAVAGTRRAGAGARAGLPGAAGRCRRAAGADRPAGEVSQLALFGRVATVVHIGAAHNSPAPAAGSLSAAPAAALAPQTRASGRRGRHDPHRRGSGGRDAAARRGQPGKAASARVNHAGIVEPGTPRTRGPANPGDLNRQRPRGRRQAERCTPRPPGS